MSEIVFPKDLEDALTKLHAQLNIDITEYVHKCVRDDIIASQEGDSILNAMLRKATGEALAVLEETQ